MKVSAVMLFAAQVIRAQDDDLLADLEDDGYATQELDAQMRVRETPHYACDTEAEVVAGFDCHRTDFQTVCQKRCDDQTEELYKQYKCDCYRSFGFMVTYDETACKWDTQEDECFDHLAPPTTTAASTTAASTTAGDATPTAQKELCATVPEGWLCTSSTYEHGITCTKVCLSDSSMNATRECVCAEGECTWSRSIPTDNCLTPPPSSTSATSSTSAASATSAASSSVEENEYKNSEEMDVSEAHPFSDFLKSLAKFAKVTLVSVLDGEMQPNYRTTNNKLR
jgi:hypothetical protein